MSRSIHSASYKALLDQQTHIDDERQAKLEELRKKQIREDIKRKRDEEESRRKAALAKERREQEVKEAKLDAERAELRKAKKLEEEKRKQPLSITEARERRDKAEAARSAKGLSHLKQDLPIQPPRPARPSLSSRYSDLLAAAPTKLDAIPARSNASTGSKLKLQAEKTQTGSREGSLGTSRPASPLKRKLSPDLTLRKSAAYVASPGPAAARARLSAEGTPERRRSPFLVSKGSNAVTRLLPPGSEELRPLQKAKRDLRTIEEIQNDVHRQKGKDYAYLKTKTTVPPSTQKLVPRAARSSLNKSSAAVSQKLQQSKDSSSNRPPSTIQRTKDLSPPKRALEERDHGLSESIWDILNPGKKRAQYLARDIDSDEEMEANAADIRREERMAERAAKLEDEREAKALKEAEERKAMKRRKVGA